ncbi:MAG: MurR/RpiR family transcriptional regulator [Terriglobia bacterium]
MTGSCLLRIRASIHGKSGATARIGQVVLKSPLRVQNLSIGDLAQLCRTSPATVYRFCRELGYDGYREFQLDLAASTAQSDAVRLEEFVEGASLRNILHGVFEYNRQSLTDTEKMLGEKELTQVARQLYRSRKVILLGLGSSALVARRGEEILISLGFTAVAITDPFTQIFATEIVGPKDVVIGISHTGRTQQIVEALQAARRKGACTVAITNYPRSALAESADFRLFTAFREHRINAAVSSSIIPQLCIIAALHFILGSWVGGRARKLASEAEHRAQRILRHPENM